MMIKCTKCGKIKPSTCFTKDKLKLDGHRHECKECMKLYRYKNREKLKKAQQKWRQEHKEYLSNRRKQEWENNKEELSKMNKAYNKTIKGHYSRYKRSAKSKGREFTIPFPLFCYLVTSPCYYCGDVNEWNGLDRVDSNKGYTEDNIVSCCTICNRAKMEHTLKDFKKQIVKRYKWFIEEDGGGVRQ